MLLVGTDEAGYGPNLGPLLVSATAWQCTSDSEQLDFENLLSPLGSDNNAKLRMPVADSKQLFSSQIGLQKVEQSLFTFLALQSEPSIPETWDEIWNQLAKSSVCQFSSIPWYADCNFRVPRALNVDDLDALVDRAKTFFASTPVDFLSVQTTSIEPELFNQSCEKLGNKSNLLTEVTLKLIHQMIQTYPGQPTLVLCDKHGGRNKYAAVLQSIFPDQLVRIVTEGTPISIYVTNYQESEIEIRFIAKGERNFPVALASMFSKYLRELAMIALNQFWIGHLPDLKPTAGYPVDAKRFRKQILKTAQRLDIDENIFWRQR